MRNISISKIRRPHRALPFWISLTLVPIIALSTWKGGWFIFMLPFYAWVVMSFVDIYIGKENGNADVNAQDQDLFWYRLITLIWPPVQFITLFSMIWYVPQAEYLSTIEKCGIFISLGVVTGSIGINYSHELMHQKNRFERFLGDFLLSMVLYSHFRSEHLRVHHIYVATPHDPVTARYNEGFFHFFKRVLIECVVSSFKAEKAMLQRQKRPVWHHSNPFWRYAILEILMLIIAFTLGGAFGVFLFILQAFMAILQLELVNYIEHYGLTRRRLGNDRYEHVQPHHSWNTSQKVSNWLLINLQRHSDHHYKPDRRFPLLQTYDENKAPQLPYGYPTMTLMALCPPLWRRIMNKKVQAWRHRFYPDITDWSAYNTITTRIPY